MCEHAFGEIGAFDKGHHLPSACATARMGQHVHTADKSQAIIDDDELLMFLLDENEVINVLAQPIHKWMQRLSHLVGRQHHHTDLYPAVGCVLESGQEVINPAAYPRAP